jgi:signal transduction histidine kinase
VTTTEDTGRWRASRRAVTPPNDDERGDSRGEPDPETAARRLVTGLLAGAARVETVFAPPERVSLRLRDGTTPSSTADLRAYFDWLADWYSCYELRVDDVLVDGDTAVVRWRLRPDGASDGYTALTEVTVDTAGVTEVAGDLEPTAVVPSSAQLGLSTVDDPVVVLSPAGDVVAVNDAAVETFDRKRPAVLGRPVAALFGPSPAFEAGEEYLVAGPTGRRAFEVRVSAADRPRRPSAVAGAQVTAAAGDRVSDTQSAEPTADGEQAGEPADDTDRAGDASPTELTADRVLVARDVTARRRRTQQLSVLVRVLRHNVRNDLDVIRSRIDAARRRGDDAVAETLAPAATQTAALLETADTANTVQSLTAEPDHHTADLVGVAREAVERARESFPGTTVVCETVVETAETTVAEGFGRAVWELVENACEHGGQTVRVSVTRHGQFWRLSVADDGPGIPDDERMVLNRAVETSLEHGSGLGLWLAKWVVDASGGALTFAVDDGTDARIELFDGDRLGDRDWPSETNS